MASTPKHARKNIKELAKINREFPMVIEGAKKKTPSGKAMKVAKHMHKSLKKHHSESMEHHEMPAAHHKKSKGRY